MDTTSQLLSVANIANSLGLSREYTEKYIFYLEQALLIKRLKKYALSVEKSVRGAEKVHIIDAGLINAFSKIRPGQLMETMVASHLSRRKEGRLYYFREKYEVDLVYESGKAIFPIEVKYQEDISRREISGLKSFSKKFKTDV